MDNVVISKFESKVLEMPHAFGPLNEPRFRYRDGNKLGYFHMFFSPERGADNYTRGSKKRQHFLLKLYFCRFFDRPTFALSINQMELPFG